MMPPRVLPQVPVRESFRDTKFRIQQRVIADLDPKLDLTNQVEVRRQIEEIFSIAVDEEGLALTRAERVRMLEQITDEIVGLGPLEPLLRDESITEVMVNGPRQVYIERSRQARADERHVPERRPRHAHHRPHHRAHRPPRRRVQPDGRRAPHRRVARQRHHPAALASSGRCITIRKFAASPFTVDDLIRFGDGHAGDVRLPEGVRRGAPQLLRLGRHRLGQDDDAQRALIVHPQ